MGLFKNIYFKMSSERKLRKKQTKCLKNLIKKGSMKVIQISTCGLLTSIMIM